HRERSYAAGSNLLNRFDRTERPKKPHEQLTATVQRNVGLAGDIVRTVTKYLPNDIGGAKNLFARGHNPGALCNVVRVPTACFGTSPRSHDTSQPRLGKIRQCSGD